MLCYHGRYYSSLNPTYILPMPTPTATLTTPDLLIFDSTNLLYRSFHGNEKLTGPDGSPTGAIYAFLTTMTLVMAKFPDAQPVFVFDAFPVGALPSDEMEKSKDRPVFSTMPALSNQSQVTRRDLYPAYKGTRSEMPPELQQQCWPLLLILNALGHPLVAGNSMLEADDVMGTLAVEAQKRGRKAVVATGDKDMAALVNDLCLVYNFNIKALLDAKGVEEKYGVSPDKIAGWLALMGDAVDNIPGVERCGEKTAAKWMNTYKTLDNVIANAGDIKGVVGDNLRAALPTLPMAMALTLLRTDTPIAFETCTTPVDADLQFLRHLYQGLGLQKHLRLLDEAEAKKQAVPVLEPT